MIVKICGLRSLEDAMLAKDCGADWLGFIFAPSRRRVSPELVRAISSQLTGCLKVGVFLDAPVAEVRETAAYCKLDLVQLHGCEDAAYRTRLALPHIKVFSLRPDGQAADADWPADADYVLLDTACGKNRGGSGVTFAWEEAADLLRSSSRPVLAAGGLTPENVKAAVKALNPFGVDVAGGVETDGRKDAKKLESFIRAAKNKEE